MKNGLMIFAAAMMVGSPVAAQDAQTNNITLVDKVAACRAIQEPQARLACFDSTTRALDDARRGGELVVLDREEVRERRRSLFGFQLPRVNLFGRRDDAPEEEIEEIDSVVQTLSPSGRGRWVFGLQDGSKWTTLAPSKFDPAIGERMRIKRAALGSYLGSFGGRTAVRVQRLQ